MSFENIKDSFLIPHGAVDLTERTIFVINNGNGFFWNGRRRDAFSDPKLYWTPLITEAARFDSIHDAQTYTGLFKARSMHIMPVYY